MAFDFFFTIIIVRGILARRIGDVVNSALTRLFTLLRLRLVRSEHDLAVWVHYQNKAANKGHRHPLNKCDDGKCDEF